MATTPTRTRPCIIESVESRTLLSAVVGLSLDNKLVGFDTTKSSYIYSSKSIGGLAAGDRVVGIDYRPANGKLYGVIDGRTRDRIIQIDPSTGQSTNVFNLTTQLVGSEFGVDVNPVADAVRITSDADQNLRVPFATGATLVDGTLAYATNDVNTGKNPNVVSSAYTNSFPGTTATVLYGIDSATDTLDVQNPPNAGTLQTRGPLGVDTNSYVGFDIQASTSSSNYGGAAYVSLTRAVDNGSRLYRIDLGTGGVRDAGAVGGSNVKLRDITLVPTGGNYNNGGYTYGGSYGGGQSGGYNNNGGSSYDSGYGRDSGYYDSQRYH